MVQKLGGFRRKTRYKLSKPRRARGKISLTNYFQSFAEGDRVVLAADSAVQKGMYYPRFHGRVAVVKKKVGRCYQLALKDGKLEKSLIVHPVHLKKVA